MGPHDSLTTIAVLVLLKSAAALFSIWVGCSSLNWFWRASVALAVIALLISPRAYDPAIGIAVQIAVVGGAIGIAKQWDHRGELGGFLRCRFQLADLFRAFFLLSLGLALILHLIRQPLLSDVQSICHDACLQSILTLAIAVLVLLPRSLRFRVMATLAFVMCWFVLVVNEFRVGRTRFVVFPWEIDWTTVQILTYGIPWFCEFLVLLASLSAWKQLQRGPGGWFRRSATVVSRLWVWGGGVCSVALLLFVWWKMTFLPDPPHIVIPVPNGFDAIVRADSYIEGDRNIDPNDMTIVELAKFVRANQRPINLTRKAVHLARQRPLTFDAFPRDPTFDNMYQLALPHVLRSSVQLALKEGRTDDAVDDAIVSLQLAARIRDGGHSLDYDCGRGIESLAIWDLTPARINFDAAQSRRLLAAMVAIDRERLPVAKIEELNRTFCLHIDYQYAFLDAIGQINQRKSGWLREPAKDAQRNLLMLELAIQAFRLEQRRLPQTLAELVPDLLIELPHDPYTNRPFIYRLDSNMGFVLYSVGSDSDDDGGMPVSWHAFVG